MASPEDDEFIYQVRRQQSPVDPAVRRIALAAGGVSVLIIVVALLWSGVRASGFGPPPVILPPPGPLRVLPASPGGLTVPEADQQIMSGNDSGPAPQLAPDTPAPAIAQLNQAAGVPGAPAPPPADTTTPTQVSAPAAAATSGPLEVQLAATVDEPGAKSVWSHLETKVPALLKGKNPKILPAVVNGQNIWRLRVGGFATPDDAKAFCAAMNSHGAACTVAAF